MPYGSESLEVVQAIRYGETTSDPLDALIEGSAMETCAERRTRKLRDLCEKTEGGMAAVAEKAGINLAYLDQILKGVLLPAKADGSRTPRSLGDPAARAIEAALDLGCGWLDGDWPLPMVSQSRYEALSSEDKAYVQAKMAAAIEEREGRAPPAPPPDRLPITPPPGPGRGRPPAGPEYLGHVDQLKAGKTAKDVKHGSRKNR